MFKPKLSTTLINIIQAGNSGKCSLAAQNVVSIKGSMKD